jgi:hypothetical protein
VIIGTFIIYIYATLFNARLNWNLFSFELFYSIFELVSMVKVPLSAKINFLSMPEQLFIYTGEELRASRL